MEVGAFRGPSCLHQGQEGGEELKGLNRHELVETEPLYYVLFGGAQPLVTDHGSLVRACVCIQGVTPVNTLTAPFRKSAKFSTPIGERLNDLDLQAEG